ncbi:class I SAM-dependent methyltransferase [Motiliproteus sp. SC1-56]|uniref:class I SAM-dependent DNA methyltransferase n=1 Tax=Motiliproteus sp. SC1-56 TaxID=2799565 RepID=UPI001A8F6CAF|nr:class I SAM-dependent methyltransferase [Motiliproteus sp. SC1-56]
MSNEWDKFAEGWDVDASVQEYANQAFRELSDVLNIDGLSVFDFGCGTGSLTQLLSPRAKGIVALDGSSEMIRILAKKKLSNVSTISGFLTQDLIDSHPHLTNKFDLIVASSVCGFLPDYEMTLGLLRSLLKSGGLFIQWDWLSNDEPSITGLSESRVLHALRANRFVDIQIKRPFEMNSSNGTMTVLMAVGKKSNKPSPITRSVS